MTITPFTRGYVLDYFSDQLPGNQKRLPEVAGPGKKQNRNFQVVVLKQLNLIQKCITILYYTKN